MALAFEEYIPYNQELFVAKVKQIASALKIDPNWLMSVMYAESRLKPTARNTKFPFKKNGNFDGYATGLIQFTPDTARGLGTTVEALYNMSNLQQLDYVHKYFKGYTGRIKSYFDTYATVFFPMAIGKPDNWVFESKSLSRASIARSNPAININGDGQITIAEFKEYLKKTIPSQFHDLVFELKKKELS